MSANKAVPEDIDEGCVVEEEQLVADTVSENAGVVEAAEAVVSADANSADVAAVVDNTPRNLYAVIYPGKFLTAAVLEMGSEPESGTVVGSLFWTAYEASTYTDRGIPDFARIRRFCQSFSGAVTDLCRSLNRNLTAVLVRTPPPAAVFSSTTNGSNPDYLQCNTFFEGFIVGMLYGLYPHTPTWYCHPNAIRALFSVEGEGLKTWSSREEESADVMSMAINIVGMQLRHDREAGCVLAAAHHYMKFAQLGFAERRSTVDHSSTTLTQPAQQGPIQTHQAPFLDTPPPPRQASHSVMPMQKADPVTFVAAKTSNAAVLPPPPHPRKPVAQAGAWGSAPTRIKEAPTTIEANKLNIVTRPSKVVVQKFEMAKEARKEKLRATSFVVTEPNA